jgi:hypothetical protein
MLYGMGKLTGYIFGLVSATFIIYYFLSAYYNPIISWLGPYLGAPLILLAGALFFLLGNPFNRFVLFPIFILIGVLIGIGSRTGRKAIGATLSVYGTLLSLTGISLLYLYITNTTFLYKLTTFSSSGFSSSSLPPVPPSTTLASVTAEPIVERLLSVFSSISSNVGVSSSTGIINSISPIINKFVDSMLLYAILNFLIVAIIAFITGRLLYKILNKPKKAKFSNKDIKAGTTAIVIIVMLMMILSVCYPVLTGNMAENGKNSVLQISNYESTTNQNNFKSMVHSLVSFHSDAISKPLSPKNYSISGAVVGSSGSQFNIYINANYINSTSLFKGRGIILSLYTVSYNLSNLMNYLNLNNILKSSRQHLSKLTNYSNFIPEGLFVEIAQGNATKEDKIMNSQVISLSKSLDSISYSKMLSISINKTVFGVQGLNMEIFSFTYHIKTVENDLIDNLSSIYKTGQSNMLMKNNIKSGSYVPTKYGGKTNSFIMMGGYVNSSIVTQELNSITGFNFSQTGKEGVLFSTSVFEKNSVYFSSSSLHIFSASTLFNYEGTLNFSDSRGNELVFFGIPENKHGGSKYTYTLLLNNATLEKSSNFGSNVNETETNGSINSGNIILKSNATFPAKLKIITSVKSIGNETYDISTMVVNEDNNTLTNLTIKDKNSSCNYSSSLSLVSGLFTERYNKTLSPGKSFFLNLSVKVTNPGKYVLGIPILTYSNNGSSETSLGKVITLNGNTEFLGFEVNGILHFYVSYLASNEIHELNILNYTLFTGFYFFDLLIFLIVVLDIYFEAKAYKKWRNQKNELQ